MAPNNVKARREASESSQLRLVVSSCFLALCAILAYRDSLRLWFTGIDAFPLLVSNRLGGLSEVPKLLIRQYLEAYRLSAVAGSTGIRPLGSASIALDYAVWGLNPFGYHLTAVLLHGLNTALVFLFVRQLRPTRWMPVGIVAALAFAIHPVGAATVPLMVTRYDLLLCTFTLLTLISVLRFVSMPTGGRLAAVLAFGGLALLSKETAVVLLPIAVLTAGWSWLRGALPARAVLRLAAAYGALLFVWVIYRTSVVHGIGGYPLRLGNPVGDLLVIGQWFFLALVKPYPLATATPGWRMAVTILSGAVGVFLVIFALVAARSSLTRGRSSATPAASNASNDLDRAALVALWMLPIFGFYAAMYLVTGVFKELYLYSVLGIWCALFGMAVVAVFRLSSTSGSVRRPGWLVAGRVSAGALLTLLAISWARHSAPMDGLRMWRRASDVASRYVTDVERAVARLPADATLLLVNLPQEVDCGTHVCAGSTYIFEDYSIDSWFALAHPGSRVRFVAVTSLGLGLDPVVPRSRWSLSANPDGRLVDDVKAAIVRHPFLSRASDVVEVTLEGRPPSRAAIGVIDRRVYDGAHFVFDPFHPAQVMSLTVAGLQPVPGPVP